MPPKGGFHRPGSGDRSGNRRPDPPGVRRRHRLGNRARPARLRRPDRAQRDRGRRVQAGDHLEWRRPAPNRDGSDQERARDSGGCGSHVDRTHRRSRSPSRWAPLACRPTPAARSSARTSPPGQCSGLVAVGHSTSTIRRPASRRRRRGLLLLMPVAGSVSSVTASVTAGGWSGQPRSTRSATSTWNAMRTGPGWATIAGCTSAEPAVGDQ